MHIGSGIRIGFCRRGDLFYLARDDFLGRRARDFESHGLASHARL